MQKNTVPKTIGAFVIIVILVGIICGVVSRSPIMPVSVPENSNIGSATSSIATTTVFLNESDWITYASSTTGVSFRYPASLGTSYIQTADWPPTAVIEAGSFTCADNASSIGPEGKTSEETINGRTYCVTIESEGAAGSVYTTYTYAFPKKGMIVSLGFILREPQCENYDEPKTSACKNEEATFNVNNLADEMAQTIQNAAVTLDSVSPTSGAVGSSITLTGSGFLSDNKILFDGNVAAADAHPTTLSNGRQSLVIAVPSAMGADCKANEACPMYARLVTAGLYPVIVENDTGRSNAVQFTVTGSPNAVPQ
jgi:hypothetical protein